MTPKADQHFQPLVRIEAFFAMLRADGMVIDPAMQRRVLRIIADTQVNPDETSYDALAKQVVPIVATSAHEQERSHRRFKEIFANEGEPAHLSEDLRQARSERADWAAQITATKVLPTIYRCVLSDWLGSAYDFLVRGQSRGKGVASI